MSKVQLYFDAQLHAANVISHLAPTDKDMVTADGIQSALDEARKACAALEALQRLMVGCDQPKVG